MHIASWKTLLKCIKSLKFGQFSSFSSSLAVSCTSCGPVKNSWDKPSLRCVSATGLDELRCDCTAHGTRHTASLALLIPSPFLPAHNTLHTPVLSALTMTYLQPIFCSVLCITAPGCILEGKMLRYFTCTSLSIICA